MKAKLLTLLFFISIFGFSQTPISNFNSADGLRYAVVTSSGAVDQSANGSGLTWNFTDLVAEGTVNEDTYSPTDPNISSYPGTNNVLTVTDVDDAMNTNKIFEKIETNTVSLTGVEREDLVLNYTDNALLGTFPMNYGVSNSDSVSGTFTYTTISGTFTGTIDVSVDAYGTLNMNDLGEGAYSSSVTRLKVVQNLTLNATSPFPVSTGATQTSYYYYDNSDDNLVFRTNNLFVSLLSVDETIMESYLPLSLSTQEKSQIANQVKIIPNIVNDVLHIQSKEVIQSVTLTDLNGRIVLQKNDNSVSIPVSQLSSGLYIASISTNKGDYIQKFMKK